MGVGWSAGSTTSASRVTGSPMIEQLHCNIPTGMVIWINPSVAALRAGRPSLMKWSISSERKGFAAGAAQSAALFDRLDEGGFANAWKWLRTVQAPVRRRVKRTTQL